MAEVVQAMAYHARRLRLQAPGDALQDGALVGRQCQTFSATAQQLVEQVQQQGEEVLSNRDKTRKFARQTKKEVDKGLV